MKPQTVNQVKDRTVRVATIETDKILALPALLKHYTALVETVQKMGGEVSTTYGTTVELTIPKDAKQLAETLKSEQASWDRYSALYEQVRNGEEIKSYLESAVTNWAEAEGLDAPEFVKSEVDSDSNA